MTGTAVAAPLTMRLRGWASAELRTLYSGYFALVMASGIVSTGFLPTVRALSLALLAFALLGFAVLCILYGLRLARYRDLVVADVSSPGRAFGFFTFVAAADVLSGRLAEAGHHSWAVAFVLVGGIAWVLLAYGIPAAVITGRHRDAAAAVSGSWLIWVVATESVATASASLARSEPGSGALAAAAVCFWGLGALLYVVVIVFVAMRLLLMRFEPEDLIPPYWITMGATAITVLAGGRILLLPDGIPIVAAARPSVQGLSLVLWAFGSWWVPLLLILGLWRHVVHGVPFGYDPAFWSIVFPLGMYGVASRALGTAEHLAFMRDIADGELWVALAAWVAVVVMMASSWWRALQRHPV